MNSKSHLRVLSGLRFTPGPVFYSIALIWIFGLGYTGTNKNKDNLNVDDKKFILKDALKDHFKQVPVKIPIDSNAAVKGNPKADITIVEFADFECPSCKALTDSLQSIWPEIENNVKLYFMNYPLDSTINTYMKRQIHKYAGIAACAGVCAQKKGDFWNYHDELFKNQKYLNRNFLLDLAEKYGWNREKFSTCMDSPEVIRRVKSDIEAGNAVKILSTPDLFINGRHVKYWNRPDFIKAVIKQELELCKKTTSFQISG
ncbi:MAG: DsbA family protein [Ignavibacteriaceae bacterium]